MDLTKLRAPRALLLAALCAAPAACRRRGDDAPPPAPTAAPREERDAAPSLDTGALAPMEGDGGVVAQIRGYQAAVRRSPQAIRGYLDLARAFVRLARESEDPRFYSQANDALERARALDPRDTEVDQLRAMMLLQDHRFREARDVARALLVRERRPHLAYGILSDAELELGNYPAAVEAAQEMIDARPDSPGYIRAAWLRWLHDDYEGALEVMRLALDSLPREPAERAWIVAMMGGLYLNRGHLADAQRYFEAARAEYAPSSQAHAGLARVAMARGEFPVAVTEAEAALRASPTPEHEWLLGDALAAAGRRADADAHYAVLERTGRRTDPRTLALYYSTNDREHAAAVELARREYENRQDVFTDDVLAWALFRNGELAPAREAIQRAQRIHTPDARILFHAGMIQRAAGDHAAAVAALTQALAGNPYWNRTESELARRTLAELGAPPVPLPAATSGSTPGTAGDAGTARDASAARPATPARPGARGAAPSSGQH